MKKGDDFWGAIDSLLDERGHAKNTAPSLNKSFARHDRAIAQHITDEIDRTSLYAKIPAAEDNDKQTVVSDSSVNNDVDSKSSQGIRTLTDRLLAWVNGGAGANTAVRPVLAFSLACVLILPFYFLLSTQQPDSSRTGASLPAAAGSFASAAVDAIDYCKGSYGLLKSQSSEGYKAFVTGVLYTDRQFYELAGEKAPEALYLTFADSLGVSDYAEEAAQMFEQAVRGYGAARNASEPADINRSGTTEPEMNQAGYSAHWFRAGGALEYVRLTATIAMADYQGDQLIEALDHYAHATSGLAMHGQSQQFARYHQQLSEKAALSVLSPDDIEAVQEHATSLKILVR